MILKEFNNTSEFICLAFLSLFFAQTDIQDPMETAFSPKNVFKNQPKSVKKTFKGRQCERSEGFQKLIK